MYATRIMLLVSGMLLCAGGLVMLASARTVEGSHLAGEEAGFILISVVPGIFLMIGGMLTRKSERSRLIDAAILVVSIIWLFVLTSVPVVVQM